MGFQILPRFLLELLVSEYSLSWCWGGCFVPLVCYCCCYCCFLLPYSSAVFLCSLSHTVLQLEVVVSSYILQIHFLPLHQHRCRCCCCLLPQLDCSKSAVDLGLGGMDFACSCIQALGLLGFEMRCLGIEFLESESLVVEKPVEVGIACLDFVPLQIDFLVASGTEAWNLRNSDERWHFEAEIECCWEIGNLGIVCLCYELVYLEPGFPGLVH